MILKAEWGNGFYCAGQILMNTVQRQEEAAENDQAKDANHRLLQQMVQSFGIAELALDCFLRFLTNRSIYIRVGSEKSEELGASSGYIQY